MVPIFKYDRESLHLKATTLWVLSPFLLEWLENLSSELDWCSNIVYIAKTTSKKTRALILSINFPSSEVALYLYKSTI